MKQIETLDIHPNMTTLEPTHPLTQTLCFLIAIGCSSHIEVAKGNGGASGAGGTGGTQWATGGAGPGTGGTQWTTPLTGGSASTSTGPCCTTPPHCDNPNDSSSTIPWETTAGPSYLSYSRTSCCTTIYCLNRTGSGGTGSTGGWTSTGGTPATGGSRYDATGGAGNSMYPKANCVGDVSCNDDIAVSSIWGTCQPDGYCACNEGYWLSPSTGKCTTYDQTVCYSPTQNINKAYVDRAFGCKCSSATDKPWCGIDSSGLRVYMSCSSANTWQSGSTSSCGAGGTGGVSSTGPGSATGGAAGG